MEQESELTDKNQWQSIQWILQTHPLRCLYSEWQVSAFMEAKGEQGDPF